MILFSAIVDLDFALDLIVSCTSAGFHHLAITSVDSTSNEEE